MKPAKRKLKLQVRQNAWARLGKSGNSESKVRSRAESGGFKCPGSWKK